MKKNFFSFSNTVENHYNETQEIHGKGSLQRGRGQICLWVQISYYVHVYMYLENISEVRIGIGFRIQVSTLQEMVTQTRFGRMLDFSPLSRTFTTFWKCSALLERLRVNSDHLAHKKTSCRRDFWGTVTQEPTLDSRIFTACNHSPFHSQFKDVNRTMAFRSDAWITKIHKIKLFFQ